MVYEGPQDDWKQRTMPKGDLLHTTKLSGHNIGVLSFSRWFIISRA